MARSIDDDTLASYVRTLKLEDPNVSAKAILDSLHAMGTNVDLARVKKTAGKVVKGLAKENATPQAQLHAKPSAPPVKRAKPPANEDVLKAEPAELLAYLREFGKSKSDIVQLAGIRILKFIGPEAHEAERSPPKAACAVLLSEMGYCEVLVDMMRAHPDVRRVQTVGCMGLLLLGKDHDPAVERAVACGAIAAIADSMERHANSDLQVDQACRALGALTDPELPSPYENCQRAMEARCHEIVIQAMRRHRNDAVVQFSACNFLVRLAWGRGADADAVLEPRRHALAAAGASRALLAASLAASGDGKLQDTVASALGELSKGSGGPARMAAAKKEAERLGIDLS